MAEKVTLARPYAKAAFEFAHESQSFEKWSTVLAALSTIVKDKRVDVLLKDRNIPALEITDFFKAVLGAGLDAYSQNFIAILAEKKRLVVLPEIYNLYQEMRAEAEKTIDLQFVTAVAIEDAQKKQFQSMLEKYLSRTVNMQCAVDPNLLGGYIATAGNYVIDGSVRGFLTNLKETMGDPIWA